MTNRPLRVAVAGLGYWGPNIARNFAEMPSVELVWCCDAAESNRARVAAMFPRARVTDDLDDVLGAPDVSVLLRLAGEEPYQVEARGESYMREGIEDVVFCFLRFPSGLSGHLHLSWLDPHKERRFTVVGEQRMATFDDMALEGKITIYDKGFDPGAESYGEWITRSGDIWSPQLSNTEPLRTEVEHFVSSVRNGTPP